MSDEEFWAHVYPAPSEEEVLEELWEAEQREVWVIDCARCGRSVEVDPDTRDARERDAFCDDCAEEHVSDESNDPWDEIKTR